VLLFFFHRRGVFLFSRGHRAVSLDFLENVHYITETHASLSNTPSPRDGLPRKRSAAAGNKRQNRITKKMFFNFMSPYQTANLLKNTGIHSLYDADIPLP
jgi:hypothetical protein